MVRGSGGLSKPLGASATAARSNLLLDIRLLSRPHAQLNQRRVILSFTLSGGLSPPPVLGAGAAGTTSNRCACPPSPLPASLTHPQPAAPKQSARLSHTLLCGAQIAVIALL
eukprot:4876068-Prymnesium_polylepis.4